MILTQLSLLVCLQGTLLQEGVPGSVQTAGAPTLAQTPISALSQAEREELLGLVPLRSTGDATGPVLTIVAAVGTGGYVVEVQNSPTSYAEEFFIQLPPSPSKAKPSPLLVAFHKFGTTQLDIPVNTNLEQECYDRNWWLLAPLGASPKSFSSISSQLNTEFVIELVLKRFSGYVDTERIYGVGFSMGGGNVMNYAARHVDPSRPMFAAIINHTGPVSLRETYKEQPAVQFIMDFWYGGGPDQSSFKYARSSVLDIYSTGSSGPIGPGPIGGGGDPFPLPIPVPSSKSYRIDFETSSVGNLSHVPLYIVRAKNDPQTYISAQLDLLVETLGSTDFEFVYKKVGGTNKHAWSTLNETKTLNWLSSKRLQLPTRGVTLIDRDATYFYFDIKQRNGGKFSRIQWELFPAKNRMHMFRTENFAELSFNMEKVGMDVDQPFRLVHSMPTDDRLVFRITGYPTAPASVTRNGRHTENWRYDPRTKVLFLSEETAGSHNVWKIAPAE